MVNTALIPVDATVDAVKGDWADSDKTPRVVERAQSVGKDLEKAYEETKD